MAASRTCSGKVQLANGREVNCPRIIPAGTRHCPAHAREHERKRGSRQQRGYDAAHDRERARWKVKVARGTVRCVRCGELIRVGDDWDLGHSDDRTSWTGPEHAGRCNRAAGGRKASRPSA